MSTLGIIALGLVLLIGGGVVWWKINYIDVYLSLPY